MVSKYAMVNYIVRGKEYEVMIKRIIFDVDDTLIDWKDEYDKVIDNVVENLNIQCSNETIEKIREGFNNYDFENYTFSKEKMSEYINKYVGMNLPKDLIYDVIDGWGKCAPSNLDKELGSLLDYLSNKYELVCLTDWFEEPQINRLKIAGIYKYFKSIYGSENTKRKPFKEAFERAIGEFLPEECVMVGDNLERDIKGAIENGLQAIWYNRKGKATDLNCRIIKNLNELKEIL